MDEGREWREVKKRVKERSKEGEGSSEGRKRREEGE